MRKLPKLFIFTGADQVTGALISSFSQAWVMRDALDVSLILSSLTNLRSNQFPNSSSVIVLPLARAGKRLGSLLMYPAALLRSGWHLHRALKQAGCDRLQINDFHFAEGAVVRLLGYRGRIVTWVRIDPKRYGLVGRIWLALARWSSDELVAVSRFIARQMPPGYRTTLIYDAVPDAPEAPRAHGRQFLFVGNYIEGKGQDSAIPAFHRIASQFPEAELVFHGSDMELEKNRNYRSSLQRLAEGGAGNGRIHLRGFVEDPAAVYRNAFAALNFSHSESFSLTCLEASAHGLAIVATRCGGPEEIVEDGVTGFLVSVGDVDSMAARMSDLIEQPARAAAMGEAGRRFVTEKFGVEQFRRQVMEVFDLY